MFERIFIASIEQSNAINASEDEECNQQDMSTFYMDCIIADQQSRAKGIEGVDWRAVNEAIIKRWPKGLVRIKEMAHKRLAKAAAGQNPYR